MPIPDAPPAETLHAQSLLSEAAGAIAAPVDRRNSARTRQMLSASLITLDGRELLRGTTDDVGEGGMHVTAPIGFGLAVGQRYEVLLSRQDDRGRENLTGEGHYATVVRTRFLVGESGHQDRVGVGLRFDQPLVL